MKKVLIITFILYTACAPVNNISNHSKDELIFKSDSLMSAFPNDLDLIQSIISAKIEFARHKTQAVTPDPQVKTISFS